ELVAGPGAVADVRVEVGEAQVGDAVVGAPLRGAHVGEPLRVAGERPRGADARAEGHRDDGERDHHLDEREALDTPHGLTPPAPPAATRNGPRPSVASTRRCSRRRRTMRWAPIIGSGPSVTARAPTTSAVTAWSSHCVGSSSLGGKPTKRKPLTS